ncbi:MAG: hypothetical protein J6X86_08275 [Bacteroidales bacterium]|nr:hypothetical protein [Bacteroidales bacterium]
MNMHIKTLMLCAAMVAMVANTPLFAQNEEKGSVMTVRECDYDTLNADDTTILGYVFMKQYYLDYLDDDKDAVVKKVYKPTMEDVREAEQLLRSKYIYIMPKTNDNNGQKTRPELKWYTRQYVFGVDENGKKYVWINALRIEDGSYLTESVSKGIVRVRDGGNYFWNVLLNISDSKILGKMINGEA